MFGESYNYIELAGFFLELCTGLVELYEGGIKHPFPSLKYIGLGVHTKLPKCTVVFLQIVCIALPTDKGSTTRPSYRGKCTTGLSSNCVHAPLNCD